MKTKIVHGKLHLIYDPTTDDFHRSEALLRMYMREARHKEDVKMQRRLQHQDTLLRRIRDG